MINWGFFKKSRGSDYPSVVVGVVDIREAMKKVTEAGGRILGGQKPGEPDDIPGVGLYVSFTDTEGNRVGMLQPTGPMGAGPQ
ncbi:MAG: glyoxalase/bleomycin resistance protein/dioxygenase [Parcubacteria group bacterium Gr01-1014_106]|nr:MAG: glyoxalase/bleomycin resistance protein/dioxygenase [Parcubacteria group bacterium Gr01-1014_106]